MSSLLEQFLLLPAAPPGSLAYHAILAFTLFGALHGALNNRSAGGGSARRMTTGLVAMLLLQVVTFIASGLVWQELVAGEILLPVLDRFAALEIDAESLRSHLIRLARWTKE